MIYKEVFFLPVIGVDPDVLQLNLAFSPFSKLILCRN
jgi:hypothetical protein